MNYNRMMRILIRNNVKPNNVNKVLIHSTKETLEHFLVKSIITKLIFDKGDGVLTEAETLSGRIIDVIQVKNGSGEIIGYEVESLINRKEKVDGVDIIEIKLQNIPTETKENIFKLTRYLADRIV